MSKAKKPKPATKPVTGTMTLKVTETQINLEMDGNADLIEQGIAWAIVQASQARGINLGSMVAIIIQKALILEAGSRKKQLEAEGKISMKEPAPDQEVSE